MASTNKTTHYDLSQYTASDKPTYLVDYNTDMSNIDTGIYNAQSKANTNESSIGTLSNLETTAKTNLVSAINELKGKTDGIGNLSNLTTSANTDLVSAINEVDAHADTNNQNIGTMTNLETTVKTSLVGATNEILNDVKTLDNQFIAFEQKFNLTAVDLTNNNKVVTDASGVTVINDNLKLLHNIDYSIIKFYGLLRIENVTSYRPTVTIENVIPLGYRPTSDITVSSICNIMTQNIPTDASSVSARANVVFKTNGNVEIDCFPNVNSGNVGVNITPVLLFMKDFGDSPIIP
ncbi:hypothetical protein J6W34_01310 [bacterium]|nr:hypothetical protein [bacterium]